MKDLKNILLNLNLRLFDGEGAESENSNDTSETVDEVVYGKLADQDTTDTDEEETVKDDAAEKDADKERNFEEEFEAMIKGEFKEAYANKVNQNMAKKTAQNTKLQQRLDSYNPLINHIQARYGISDNNPETLLRALQGDTAYLEAEAERRNMSVEDLQHLKQIEMENRELKRVAEETQNQELANKQAMKWARQAEEFSAKNPAFDMQAEIANPEFINLLKAGIPVEHAYNVLHMNDIVKSAQKVSEKKVIERVKSRNARPDELSNGLAKNVTIKSDPSTFTDDDLVKIREQALRGKKIYF